jgi:L-ascorbate metabolism protein UlaG (beta-lactamase superfamily)
MVKTTFMGHSCFLIDDGKYKLIIDPFLKGNPVATVKPADIKVDYVLLTHGHGDHINDVIEIAQNCDAPVISNFELSLYFGQKGIKKTIGPQIGGGCSLPFGSIKLTIAHHGSTLGSELAYGGSPAGFIIRIGGKTLYHSGDTGLFLDMKLIGELDKIDIAMLPIGGFFTMDIHDAARAVEFLHPRKVIPMHFNTFDLIKADPHEFAKKVKHYGADCIILNPGESFTLE